MELRLLGPVELTVGGQPVEVGPPQRCAVLAALAIDAGRPVAVETLIRRVWGDNPPDRVRRALHAHIARLRRLLETTVSGDERPVPLSRRSGGYLFDIDPDRVDLHRFRRLLDEARDPNCADAHRVTLLRAALALWRGEPLAGLTELRVADTLTHLGDTHHAAGDLDNAATEWRRALSILDELNHPDGDHLRAKLATLFRRNGNG